MAFATNWSVAFTAMDGEAAVTLMLAIVGLLFDFEEGIRPQPNTRAQTAINMPREKAERVLHLRMESSRDIIVAS
ncbi:MAG TPA: hypothetical protein VG267_22045 [Terracidiphilus sp.]|nr:hypothetical protein [Terracidiphilus sp.]